MNAYTHLTVATPAPHLRVITFNRPDAANAFNTKMAQEITDAMASAASRESDARCIILTGAGTRAFCAGADLKERDGMTDDAWHAQHRIFEKMFLSVMECPLPVIAAVNGAAFGGGCEIALACDFVYASRMARFALTETSLGIIPGGGATHNLPRAVGMPRAKEIIFSAQPFSADEAATWGMVNRVVDPEMLLEAVTMLGDKITRNAPVALRAAKRALRAAMSPDAKTGYAKEIEAYVTAVETDDRREGVRAFTEKRAPQFKGR
jgi:enoyl-CoA hydratase/carnithine racemase